jgi:hypothetical protein
MFSFSFSFCQGAIYSPYSQLQSVISTPTVLTPVLVGVSYPIPSEGKKKIALKKKMSYS